MFWLDHTDQPRRCSVPGMTDPRDLAQVRRLVATGQARQVRILAALSQAEMAADIGVTASAVGNWEQGIRQPRGDAAVRYLRLLERLLTP